MVSPEYIPSTTLAQMLRIDLMLRREVIRFRSGHGLRDDEDFRGLYVSEAEVDALLDPTRPSAAWLEMPLPEEARGLDAGIVAAHERAQTLEAQHPEAPLSRLCRLLGLSHAERDILLIALASEVDLKYERLFAYLQDDVNRKRPSVDLALKLLFPNLEARFAGRQLFEAPSRLLHWELITLAEEQPQKKPALLSRLLRLDERVAGYLLGSQAPDARLLGFLEAGSTESPHGLLPSGMLPRLQALSAAWPRLLQQGAPLVLLYGRYGTGRREAAQRLAQLLQLPLLTVSVTALLSSELRIRTGMKLIEREALLTGKLILWTQAEVLLNPSQQQEPEAQAFLEGLRQGRVPAFLLSEKGWDPPRELSQRPFVRLEMPTPSYAARKALWSAGLESLRAPLSDEELEALVSRFRITGGQVRDALMRAQTLALARDPQEGKISLFDVDAACRAQAQHRLTNLAKKIEPHYGWNDLVLPKAQLNQLKLMCSTVRQRSTVYGDWGFNKKLAHGVGVISLFSGPSGTGKTMSASILARELGLELYKIDLSSVVSKYIGETEKNLERIFSEAQDTDAILFFDEADALFGKRSEVKDAHDRYANLEVAYLLQRTEEYSGLVILASNLKKNLDEAFVRRLHFTVDFPMPEEQERLEIWRRTFPSQAPVASDLDLGFMARKFKLAGGNIRNIVLGAAFIAADHQQPIAMRHLIRAASHEFQKMGKLLVPQDFEPYFEFVR
ncbi:MAG: ATP-binding protein [Myxococcota bacterium]